MIGVAELPVRWQAGYPHSGNTWLCFMLAGLCDHVPQSWDEATRLVPNWDQVAMGKKVAPLGWVRCHIMFNYQFLGHVEGLGGVREALYIVRHPLSVMMTAYRYQQQYHDLDMRISDYVDRFIHHQGEPDNDKLGAGTWNDNVVSWDRSGIARVRFEDLKTNATKELRRLTNHKVTPQRIAEAINGANKDRMRQLDTQKFVGGKSRRWEDVMTRVQRNRARRAFGDVAFANGYKI